VFGLKIQRHVKGKMWKKWWLCHATDFQSLMYPCFTFCRILGIFPYKFEASIFKASKPYYILSATISYTYCVFSFIFIYGVSKINYKEITKNIQMISYCMLSAFMVIITHVLNDARMRLLQTILEISKLPSESYQKLSRLIHVKDILAIIFKIIYIYIQVSKLLKLEINYLTVLTMIFSSYFALLELQISMLYINCICVLKTCFKRINDTLVHMQIMINNKKKDNLRLICHVQRNQFLLELKTQKKQHLMVFDAVRMLNVIFSLQLLAIVIMTFHTSTFYLYFYTVNWQDGIFISLNKYYLDKLLMSMVYNIIKITLLVWACETCKNQAQEIVTTIHDLLNSTKDNEIKKEVKI